MKVAFVVDKCAPFFVGGYESRFLSIAKRLSGSHEIRVVTSLDSAGTQIDGVTFVRSNLPTSAGVNRFTRSLPHSIAYSVDLLRNPFEEWVPDVVIIEAIPFVHLAAVDRWIRQIHSVVVLNVNEAWFDYPYFRGALSVPSRVAVRYLLRKGLDFSDLVITISKSTAESLRANYGFDRSHVIPMGLDHARLDEGDLIDFADRKFDFMMLGRVVQIKRHRDFLYALSRLMQEDNWHGRAAIVGAGPQLGQIRQLARDLGLSRSVSFFGEVPDEEKFRLLGDSRAFVLCSEREGFSLATLEAQGAGTPVVVARPTGADVFGVSDIVEDGVTGLFYPTGDTERLAKTLCQLNHDNALGETLARNGRRQALRYDWDLIVSDLERLLVSQIPDLPSRSMRLGQRKSTHGWLLA